MMNMRTAPWLLVAALAMPGCALASAPDDLQVVLVDEEDLATEVPVEDIAPAAAVVSPGDLTLGYTPPGVTFDPEVVWEGEYDRRTEEGASSGEFTVRFGSVVANASTTQATVVAELDGEPWVAGTAELTSNGEILSFPAASTSDLLWQAFTAGFQPWPTTEFGRNAVWHTTTRAGETTEVTLGRVPDDGDGRWQTLARHRNEQVHLAARATGSADERLPSLVQGEASGVEAGELVEVEVIATTSRP